jgi:hypothetical protein
MAGWRLGKRVALSIYRYLWSFVPCVFHTYELDHNFRGKHRHCKCGKSQVWSNILEKWMDIPC